MKLKIWQKNIMSFLLLTTFLAIPFLVFGQFDPAREQGGSGLASTSVYEIITTVMKWLLLILTVVAVIGFIISGLMFIIGGGSERVDKAKSWLTFSIVGIVVALIGYIAINLIDTLLRGQVQQ